MPDAKHPAEADDKIRPVPEGYGAVTFVFFDDPDGYGWAVQQGSAPPRDA